MHQAYRSIFESGVISPYIRHISPAFYKINKLPVPSLPVTEKNNNSLASTLPASEKNYCLPGSALPAKDKNIYIFRTSITFLYPLNLILFQIIQQKSLDPQNNSQKKGAKKRLFRYPWKYREGFIIALILLVTGFIIELVTPLPGISIPAFPFNMYAGMAFMTTIAFLHFFYSDVPAVRWLSTIPSATSAILLVVLLTIFLGVFIQNEPASAGWMRAVGLTHVSNSWAFLLAQLYLLICLGLVILRRAIPLKRKNIGFILNHGGLWIVIAAASLGTGDLQRLRMDLYQGDKVWFAYDNNSNIYELPFVLELINFDIEEYPPQIGIVDSHTGMLSDQSQIPLPYVEAGKTTTLMDYTISIEEFMPMAIRKDGDYLYSEEPGAPPHARVRVTSRSTGEIYEAWISCGSFMFDPRHLWLEGRDVLVMTRPEPRKYQSHVIAHTMTEEPRELFIEVNRPPRVAGWRLYQLSYNQEMGKWSDLSVIEAVRDPWLPVVYLGIAMLFAGAAYIFWIGKEPSKELTGNGLSPDKPDHKGKNV